LIAVRKTTSSDISVNHVNKDIYPSQTFPVDPEVKVDYINNYLKYFRAGYRAGVKGMAAETLKGMDVVISGNVPVAAGLSSSSALCVCSALAALQANSGDDAPFIEGSREHFIERVITG
jgi:galactokinase